MISFNINKEHQQHITSLFSLLQVGLLNVDGFYNSLLSFVDKAVEEGFINPTARHIIVSAPTARELVKKLEVVTECKISISTYGFHC